MYTVLYHHPTNAPVIMYRGPKLHLAASMVAVLEEEGLENTLYIEPERKTA